MLGGGGSNSQKPNRPGRRRNRFALSFDGSNDYVDTGLTHQATFRSNFSVGFWIKPDDGQPSANDYAIGGIESGNTDGLLFQIGTNGKITIQFKSNNDPLSIRSDAAVFSDGAASNWMHILVVVADANPSTIILYTDGTVQATSILSSQELSRSNHQAYTCNDNIWLGAANANGSGSSWFAGDLDEFAVWSGALPAGAAAVIGAQVLNLRQPRGNYLAAHAATLTQWLRFEDGSGTQLRDRSGNASHGTLSGASFVKGAPATR